MLLLAPSSVVHSSSSGPLPASKAAPRTPRRPRGSPLQTSSTAAYDKDLRLFIAGGGSIPCDASTLKKYIWKNRDKAPATLYRRAMAVRHAHLVRGLPSPTTELAALLKSLHRGFVPDKKMLETGELPTASTRRRSTRSATPITRSMLGQMLEPLPRNALDRRDRALVLLTWGAALRRAEVVAINIESLRFTTDALVVIVGQRQIALPMTNGPLCAGTAVRELVQRAAWDIEGATGPLFRRADRGGSLTDDRLDAAATSLIVKKLARAVGLDASRLSGQSLRAGRLAEIAKGRM